MHKTTPNTNIPEKMMQPCRTYLHANSLVVPPRTVSKVTPFPISPITGRASSSACVQRMRNGHLGHMRSPFCEAIRAIVL